MSDCTAGTGSKHNLVLVDEGVLIHAPEDVTSRYVIADLHVHVNRTQGYNPSTHMYLEI